MGVSENGGTPKSSILIGISIINCPFWGPPIFGNTHMLMMCPSYWKKNSKPKNKKGPVGPVPLFWAEAFADLE